MRMKVQVQLDFPHELSWGELVGTVKHGSHVLKVGSFWNNCGATWTKVECSCGFSTSQTHSTGCWQSGHDTTTEFVFDGHHELLFSAIGFKGQLRDMGCPAEWDFYKRKIHFPEAQAWWTPKIYLSEIRKAIENGLRV